MTNCPKDGSTFVMEDIVRTAYRWAKYKPDGARQMKKPGRWQRQVWSGDYFRWENCDEPTGYSAPDTEAGPLQARDEAIASLISRVEMMEKALKGLLDYSERNTCIHEDTHRGGFLWTICDGCGRKWADDEGGFQPHVDAPEVVAARAALQAQETK